MNKAKTNLFVAILSYKVPLEKIDEFRAIHLDFLESYYQRGMFIASGPWVPRTGGVIIAKCDSKEDLQKILAQDPFAINELAIYEIIEFSPTKWSKEFEGIVFMQGQEDDPNKILEKHFKKVDKLIRDKLPQIMRASGAHPMAST